MTYGLQSLAAIAASIAIAMMSPAAADSPKHDILRFDELLGWEDDNHAEALAVFLNSCTHMSAPEWQALCALAQTQTNAKAFFELFFRPVVVHPDETALFTGYFEPELKGSLVRTSKYRHPIYAKPTGLIEGQLWKSRAEIEDGILEGQGLEIAWVDDPVDVFFLHIQGSGRVALPDGNAIRVGYAAKNGHEYRSVGEELIRRGEVAAHRASAKVIRSWVRQNPVEGRELLHHNPSYVFFRKIKNIDEEEGPIGALNRSITAMRTVAVDPKFTQMGAPVWIEKGGPQPLRRLMIAQDVGSAIKGAQRADIFFGSGDAAGEIAGRTKNPGRMVVLLPIAIANRLVPEG